MDNNKQLTLMNSVSEGQEADLPDKVMEMFTMLVGISAELERIKQELAHSKYSSLYVLYMGFVKNFLLQGAIGGAGSQVSSVLTA